MHMLSHNSTTIADQTMKEVFWSPNSGYLFTSLTGPEVLSIGPAISASVRVRD